MKLFENKVGRPSDELLRKRKLFYVGVIMCVLLVVVMGIFSLNKFLTTSLLGASSSSEFSSGERITLNSTKVYKYAFTSTIKTTANGTYYIYDKSVTNGRIKITDKSSNVGKVNKYFGWVKISDINKSSSQATTRPNTTTSSNSPIQFSSDGQLVNGVYLFDTTGQKVLRYTLKNDAKKKLYYRWFTYKSNNINSNNLHYVGNCVEYNSTISKNLTIGISNEMPQRAGVMRTYQTYAHCAIDSSADSSMYMNEKKVFYNLRSSMLSISMTPTGTIDSQGVVPVDKEQKYTTTVTFKNETGQKLYYRWFTYNSYDSSKDPSWNKGECEELNSTATEKWNITMSSTYPKRSGKVKIYSNLNSCKSDSKSSSNTNVVASKSIKYGLKNVYISEEGFKMIWYNHKALSKKVGTQRRGECAKASYAHAAFILSKGKIVASKTNYIASKYGMVEEDLSTKREVNALIISKINEGIPVSLHVINNNNEHWVTVVGYRDGKNNANLALSDIYIIDPWYSTFRYNSKSVTLWRGVASNRSISVRSFHSDYKAKTWNKVSDLKQP